jgi:peptidylprolyl isomerase
MPKAKAGDTIRVHYTGKLEQGVIFDSSRGEEPLQFKIGEGRLIPGFEEAVIGMAPGETKTIRIPPEKGYGRYREDKVITIERKDLPVEIVLAVGMTLEFCAPEGQMVPVEITELTGTTVTLDANHPLADQNLIFDIELVEIVERAGDIRDK